MPNKFAFDSDILHSVAGGRSAIEIKALNIRSLAEADSFLVSYGFDLTNDAEQEKLWYYHRRALVLLTERLGYTEIPESLADRKSLGDIRRLLLLASESAPEQANLQRWACAILRCMHVYVHAESDLFGSFAQDIQAQILTPFQNCIVHDSTGAPIMTSAAAERAPIPLKGFEIKPFKTSTSTVIKLLARPDALAMKVFDKLGLRFITKNLFDSFQVIRFLVDESLISFPHIMPDQSSNTLFPVQLFIQTCEELLRKNQPMSDEQILACFEQKLVAAGADATFLRKPNEQSDSNFRFIKFITRKLIHVKTDGKEATFSFFYPFEVQIMDEKAYQAMQSGPLMHAAYKERQYEAARRRLFPEGPL